MLVEVRFPQAPSLLVKILRGLQLDGEQGNRDICCFCAYRDSVKVRVRHIFSHTHDIPLRWLLPTFQEQIIHAITCASTHVVGATRRAYTCNMEQTEQES